MFEIRRIHTMYPSGFKKRSIGLMKRENPVELVKKLFMVFFHILNW